ncbi:MAG: CaiB/BaiF CoA-transferase family protein [Thermodesulfobacteriota bacterium]|nr:CaiB/BaiF CoA-transferase family protein [Thermodesulfobacteriota bacterium]
MTDVLAGIRVIDLSLRVNGSYCTMLLGDLGAEVININRPGLRPEFAWLQRELLAPMGRNKKSLTLNLRTDEGKEIFAKLTQESDIIVLTYLPEMAKRLGVDYETVNEINSNIIYCSLTGYGQDGPYCDRPSHDVDCLGISAVMSIPGSVVPSYSKPGIPVGSLAGNLFGFASILAALLVRPKIERGQFIDVGASDVLFSWASVRAAQYMFEEKVPKSDEWGHIGATSDVFDTKDGKKIILCLIEDDLWQNFCEAAKRSDLAKDESFSSMLKRKENSKKLHDILKELVLTKTRDEWTEILSKKRICFSPVNELNEAFEDPHFKHRGLVKEIDYPDVGPIKQVAFPVKFSETPAEIRTPPPSPGQHTDEILRFLGYPSEKIAYFHQGGIV